ncbi:MAG: c-type cytochrome [Chitinophagaceae bacterium]|nr:c-type cytochrome [Chitinophagaceae bacterium]MCW5926142.1 c-type cytochrome [Chitinophagaceae bacterium]
MIISSCGTGDKQDDSTYDSLTDEQKRLPENALKGLAMAAGLEIQPYATEPLLVNPTNIDIDEKGRVWVIEAHNYRPWNGYAVNPNGDRVIILEDTNGDGKADTTKVFYQSPEMNAPLGISVQGNRVIVSQSPYVWVLYDDDGDDKADRKEIFFQGIGGEQHDHGMHAFIFGPDGKLYFNFGNEGRTLRDKDSVVVKDQDGDEIGPSKYREGMVFRCNPDGSEVECLGHNFRNNFELAVDSYGTMWQSDNDDDGNKGVRINYVMDYGNYGFKDEMTGASWPTNRINIEDSTPFRHWHLNDPGVVPNLLQTGSGSPTGIVLYEGDLLPEVFRNQMIHCEPGHNVVRSYPVQKSGAGYTAEIVNIAKQEKDQWFRPSDVCVAPDGSLFVADWYDPGVGGHQMGDNQRGRIYRIAPKGKKYIVPAQDYSIPEGAITALQNPNLAVRRKAWYALQEMKDKAVPALEKLWNDVKANPRMRARAFWVLAKQPGGEKYITRAIHSDNPDFRMMGIRAARQLKTDIIAVVKQLAEDKDPQVRRECILALRHNNSPEAALLWSTLATQYDGKDRWYLEALGIGADRQWERFFGAYLQQVPDPLQSAQGRDIVWRARSKVSLPYLEKLATDNKVDWKERQRYFRAFDFNTDPLKKSILLQMLADNKDRDRDMDLMVLNLLSPEEVKQSPSARKVLTDIVNVIYGSRDYIRLVGKFQLYGEKPRLMQLIQEKPGDIVAKDALKLLLGFGEEKQIMNIIAGSDTLKANNIIRSTAGLGGATVEMQKRIITGKYGEAQKQTAASVLGMSYWGMVRGVEMLKDGRISEKLIPAFMSSLSKEHTPANIWQEAESFLSGGIKATAPFNRDSILDLKGNADKGRDIYALHCIRCHQLDGKGIDFGPKLSEIGSKLPKEALLDAIENPSAGISFGYETYEITLVDGSVVMGLITSKSGSEIQVKYPDGNSEKIDIKNIKSQRQLKESIMPALHQAMAPGELADLLAYLGSLKKK